MEFRQAEHFLAVVEHGGVVRAAAALHLAQPSLSQSIRVLEREMGTPLFHRVGRGLVPTPVGAALVDPARQLLRDVATAQASVAELSGLHGGHVDLGATAGPSESPLPELIGELRLAYPSVSVHLSEFESEADVARAVRDGSVELGFGYLDTADTAERTAFRLESHQLQTDELCVALRQETADALPDPLPFELLPDLPVIAVTSGALGRVTIEAALRRASRRTKLGVVTAHRQAVVPLVAAGAGMAWTTASVVDNSGESGVVPRAMEPPVLVDLAIMHRPGVLSPAARALLETALRWRDRQV